MRGNPHVQLAELRLAGVHEWQCGEGSTDATNIAAAIDAMTTATLAVAHEQRTANLIAAYNAEVSGQGRIKGDGIAIDRHNEILDRLGL